MAAKKKVSGKKTTDGRKNNKRPRAAKAPKMARDLEGIGKLDKNRVLSLNAVDYEFDITPPDKLEGHGLDLWNIVVPPLYEAEILHEIDKTALYILCTTYADWRMLEDEAKKSSVLIKNRTQDIIQNPYRRIAIGQLSRVLDLLNQFGMTPAARSKLNLEKSHTEAVNEINQARSRLQALLFPNEKVIEGKVESKK